MKGEINKYILLEWIVLNAIIIVVLAVFISICYRERRARGDDSSIFLPKEKYANSKGKRNWFGFWTKNN